MFEIIKAIHGSKTNGDKRTTVFYFTSEMKQKISNFDFSE